MHKAKMQSSIFLMMKSVFVPKVMLALLVSSVLLTSLSVRSVAGWSNGGYSADPSNPDYGTHDWIAEHALDWLPTHEKQYIVENLAAYLYGTELPDNSQATDGIGDTGKHHVYYWSNGSIQDDAAAVRASEEYNETIEFLKAGDYGDAAKNAGIMSHYIADLTVFGHVMGKNTDWSNETHHTDYETHVNSATSSYTSLLNAYLVFDGDLRTVSAYDAALDLAFDTTLDIDGDLTCVWMDDNYNWSNSAFTNRVGESLNLAVNYLTDVLHTLYTEYISSISATSIDIYTQRGGKGSNQTNDAFGPQEEVILYAEVLSNSIPAQNKTVLFEIHGPTNPYWNVTLAQTAVTNASGIAVTNFTLIWSLDHPEEISFGDWRVIATTEINGHSLRDAVTFKNGYIIEILSIETGSMKNGIWIPRTIFARNGSQPIVLIGNNDSVQIRITAKNIMFTATNVTFAFSLQDSDLIPFAVSVLNYTMPGRSNATFVSAPMLIPYWALLGTGTARVDAFDKPVSDIYHRIYCPEKSSPFSIVEDLYQPVTSDDSGLFWYTSDVTINLTARDNNGGVGVYETYYSINGGPVKILSKDGQPRITTESAYNEITYWSIDLAGNEENHHSSWGIQVDRQSPLGSIQINNNASYSTSTNVTLTLTAADYTSGPDKVRFSNNDTWSSIEWEVFLVTKNWTLTSGDGIKTVYYQVRDRAGLVSAFSAQTILDTTPPTGSIIIAHNASNLNSTSVILTITAEDTTSGVAQMRFSNNNATWTTWEPYSNTRTWSLTSGDGEKAVYVQYVDNAGLVSSYQDKINLNTTSPMTNPPSNPEANDNQPVPVWIVGASIIIIAFIATTILLALRRRQK